MSHVEIHWIENDFPRDRQLLEDELNRKHKLFRDIPVILAALDGKFGETALKIWLNSASTSGSLRGSYYVECWRDRHATQFLLYDADVDEAIGIPLFKDMKCVSAEQFKEYGKTILTFFEEKGDVPF